MRDINELRRDALILRHRLRKESKPLDGVFHVTYEEGYIIRSQRRGDPCIDFEKGTFCGFKVHAIGKTT